MTTEEFNEILEHRIIKIKETLGNKGKEYASDIDRLHNFIVASRVLGTSRRKALWGMFIKHFVSIQDMIEQDFKPYPIEYVEEKIGDGINYLILLEAMLKEQGETK